MTKYTNALLSGCKNSADMKIRILSPICKSQLKNVDFRQSQNAV